jgi:L-alanine-DL-glutamate epimerase-like enolase superfamily enzyme
LAWIEEPVAPRYLHKLAGRHFSAPLAAGEHCYGPHEFELFTHAGVQVWQPDSMFCGGLANLAELMELAAAAQMQCCPHGGGLLPALHVAALGLEVSMLEWHVALEPVRQAHFVNPMQIAPSRSVSIPAEPGWLGDLREDLDLVERVAWMES